jgi:hypothetical protein
MFIAPKAVPSADVTVKLTSPPRGCQIAPLVPGLASVSATVIRWFPRGGTGGSGAWQSGPALARPAWGEGAGCSVAGELLVTAFDGAGWACAGGDMPDRARASKSIAVRQPAAIAISIVRK